MDPYGFSAAGLMAEVLLAGQLAGTEVVLAAPAVNGIDFSLAAMFLRATTTVQIVMVMLLVASFWSWAVIVEKVLVCSRLTGKSSKFEDQFWSGPPLGARVGRGGPRRLRRTDWDGPMHREDPSGSVELAGAEDPVLSELWDNEQDAAYDRL